jgi:peroxiredoxin
MSPLKRIFLLITALAALTAALVILINTGLPERAQFTGEILPNGLMMAPELNAIAPDFTLMTLDDAEINLASLRGTPLLINYWATWCEPCRVEMPILQDLYETHRASGLRILAVNLGETPDIIRRWVDEYGLTFDIVLDPQQSLAALYQIRGQPSTYAVSSSGIITAIYYGPVSIDQLQAVIP